MGEKKYTCVSGEVYLESGNIDECIKRLVYNGFSGYRSPVHQPDNINKKEHFHIMLLQPKQHGLQLKTWREVFDTCLLANGFVHINNYPHDSARYLIHLRNPDKQQFDNVQFVTFDDSYNNNDLVQFGSVPDYKEYITIEDIKKNKNIVNSCFVEVIKFINQSELYNYASLLTYCINYKNEWIECVTKYHSVILSYMRSCVYSSRIDNSVHNKYSLAQELKVISNVYTDTDSKINSTDIDCLSYLTTVLFDEN